MEINDETNVETLDKPPPPIWTASAPDTPNSQDGKVTLDDAVQFDTVSGPMVAIPSDFSVGYRMTRGWGSAVRTYVEDISRKDFGLDKYWTDKGVKTQAQLIDQFRCSEPDSA